MTPAPGSDAQSAASILSSGTKGGRVAGSALSDSKKPRADSIPRGLPRPEESATTAAHRVRRATAAGSCAVKPRLCRMYAGRGSLYLPCRNAKAETACHERQGRSFILALLFRCYLKFRRPRSRVLKL